MKTISPPETRLGALLLQMRKLRLVEKPRNTPELTLSQLEMVGFIHHMPGCRVQEIAEGLGLSAPTVSVTVRRLEESGWLERSPDPQDKRATCISLTKKSSQLIKRVQTAQMQGLRRFLAGLAEDEQEQLINLLERAINAAIERQG